MTAFVREWLIINDRPISTNRFGTIAKTTGRESGEGREQYLDYFWLKPMPPGILEVVLESWEIWCRWHAAWRDGKTVPSTHPALPEDRARHEVLETILRPLSQVSQAEMKQVGETRRAPYAMETNGGFYPLEIRWSAPCRRPCNLGPGKNSRATATAEV